MIQYTYMRVEQNNPKERAGRVVESHKGAMHYRKALSAAAALALFAGAGCAADEKTPQAQREISNSYTVESDDVQLHVLAQGGPDAEEVTIALHGGPGLSIASLDDLSPLASEDRLLVRYDQRGAGDSTAPTDGDFRFKSQLEDIEAIRQSTGAEKVDLIGRSWGGLLATAYAATNPENVDDLVLLSSIPLDINEFLAGQERFGNRVTELQRADIIPDPLPGVEGDSCEERLNAVLPAYMSDPAGETPTGVGNCTASTSQQTYEAITEPNLLEPYKALAADYEGDVLVLAGEKDPFGVQWPRTITKILRRGAVKTVIYKDTGHFVTFEKPTESIDLIRKFIE